MDIRWIALAGGICCGLAAAADFTSEAQAIAAAIAGPGVVAEVKNMTPRERWFTVASKDELLADWLSQDAGIPHHQYLLDLDDPGAAVKTALGKVGVKVSGKNWKAALATYRRACLARRAKRLEPVVKSAPKWVMCRHWVMGGSHYAYTEAQSDARGEFQYHAQIPSALVALEATANGFWKETVLFESKIGGCYRDADVSFDGKRVLYAYCAKPRSDDFHLYEMNVADGKVRKLTDGAGYSDYEGCYLPNGQIVFNSTRCTQIVDCFWTNVSNLYRIEADGSKMTRLTYDQVHDNYPVCTWNGRVLYTRWEYNDRSQVYPQPLFGMDWDGTNQRAVYGDNSWYPTTILHARQVARGNKIFAICTGHHSRQPGQLIMIDPSAGRQEDEGIWEFTPALTKAKAKRVDAQGQRQTIAAYPYPLGEQQMLVAYLPEGWHERKDNPKDPWPEYGQVAEEPLGLYWLNVDGERELLRPRFGGQTPCGRMVPLRARPTPTLRATKVDPAQKTGTVFLQDVYVGPGMEKVRRGSVKTIRLVSIDYRPVGFGGNVNGGRGGGADISTPPSISNGSWDPKIPIGDATVEADGSAWFEAPANVPFYFMLLDGKGRMIQTMRSWTMLQPGEGASCVGCHESRNDAPPPLNVRSQASLKPAQKLQPIFDFDGTRGLSFRRDIQPILNARCVRCHVEGGKAEPDLTDKPLEEKRSKRIWTQSYVSLTHAKWKDGPRAYIGDADNKMLNWVSAASEPTPLAPYSYGSNASRLFSELLDKGHAKGITDEEVRKLAMWVDLAVPFCGTYDEANTWDAEEKAYYEEMLEKRANSLKPPIRYDACVWRADDASTTTVDGLAGVHCWRDAVVGARANLCCGPAPTVERNLFNGHKGLVFDGGGMVLKPNVSPASGQSEWSVAIVFKTDFKAKANAGNAWWDMSGICGCDLPGGRNDWALAYAGESGQTVVAGVGTDREHGEKTTAVFSDRTAVSDGKPHVAIMTVKGREVTVAVDGSVVTKTAEQGPPRDASPMYLCYQTEGDLGKRREFRGAIAELRTYRGKALSLAEINRLTADLVKRYGGRMVKGAAR